MMTRIMTKTLGLGSLQRVAVGAFLFFAVIANTPSQAVEIVEVESKGGIKAWLIEDRNNPIISMKFAFSGGSSVDPAGKEGLANFVAATIDEGSDDLDSQAFQGKLNDLSISLGFDAGREFFSGQLVTLKKIRR